MKRCALQYLMDWKKKKNRKPLLIHGARQVGKTWLMKRFGETCYGNTVYFNFEKNKRIRELFENYLDPNQLLLGLEVESKGKIHPQDTLIIFDEIQACPQAITSLKYFYEDKPEYSIVAAGSLLGVALHQGVSYPVGKVDSMTLYPLTFWEYLHAMGEERLCSLIQDRQYDLMKVFKDKLTEALKQYFFIGGMPEVVYHFVQNKDFQEVRRLQKQILSDYRYDFSKHVPVNVLPKLVLVWDSIPRQLSKENKKFIYNQLMEKGRAKDFEDAIAWLKNSGLIYKIGRASKPSLPLRSYVDMSIFKLFFVDVGLLSAMSALDARVLLEGDTLFTEFKGALTEQYVCQELQTIAGIEMSYWGNDTGNAEVDFLVQCNSFIVPVEVKAAMNLKAKSLKIYIDKFNPSFAIRTSLADYNQTANLYDVPLFMVKNIAQICKN
ncbi:MAG: AAA family ATPase [Kiritimatiellia bacterium]